jgi:hypothetical protein
MSSLITPIEYIYISEDSFDNKWIDKTSKILEKCFKELPIRHFLNFVFNHKKSLKFIQNNKELREVCIDRIDNCLSQLYVLFLKEAPEDIIEIFNHPSYVHHITSQVEVLRYILSTHKTHSFINDFRELIHYKSIINAI